MKKFILLCLLLWVMVFTVPLITATRNGKKEIPTLPIPTAEPPQSGKTDSQITVSLSRGGKTENLSLEEYIVGVVAAEMPASFPVEALKAQAVAARTYTMKKLSEEFAPEHNGAALCDNPGHCKAYKPIAESAAAWKNSSDEYTQKIKNAVSDTDGEILLYQGEPITAVFHSTSSGKTESSKDVWGGDLPYLVSVESRGDEASPNYEKVKKYQPEEFKKIFSEKYPTATFDPNPENWLTNISRSDAGGVKTISIGGVSVKGSDVRTLFGLNSTNFTILYLNGEMEIRTFGYGHGVGMSQYGAKHLAANGNNYEEILKTYYTGVTLGKIGTK